MYYVLSFEKGTNKKDFQSFNTEDGLILYLLNHGNEILIHKIIQSAAELKFGLINVLDAIEEGTEKEEIEDFKEAGEELLEEEVTEPEELTQEEIDAEILRKNKEALQSTEDVLEGADKAIATAKEEMGKSPHRTRDWDTCTTCKTNKVAPWSKHKECSSCRRPKGTRKYDMTKRGESKK